MIFDNIHQHQIMPPDAFCVDTCLDNDKPVAGGPRRWSWANPTNTRFPVEIFELRFCSLEEAWQRLKVFTHDGRPTMIGADRPGRWRVYGKKRRPVGHWAGDGAPLITSAAEARRRIYLPLYKRQIELWARDPRVQDWIAAARAHEPIVYIRDWDIGKGVENDGPMSHGWLLAYYLNNGRMPK